MKSDSSILVTGAAGMVGSALMHELHARGYKNAFGADRKTLDLLNYGDVMNFFVDNEPSVVFHAAGVVGGINANNNHPVEFLMNNVRMAENLFRAVNIRNRDTRICFFGSSCIYPRQCPQPICEDFLLTGSLEETNRPYAIAKIAGVEMVRAYNRQVRREYKHVAVMPTNLYGPGDKYNREWSHVIPALILRFHTAKETQSPGVRLWGTGEAKREFMYVRDLAGVCVNMMERPALAHDVYNIGSGQEVSIAELAQMVAEVVGYTGDIVFSGEVGDGTPRKLLDCSRIQPFISGSMAPLAYGLRQTYVDFLERHDPAKTM